jgi:hypothetical protein
MKPCTMDVTMEGITEVIMEAIMEVTMVAITEVTIIIKMMLIIIQLKGAKAPVIPFKNKNNNSGQ